MAIIIKFWFISLAFSLGAKQESGLITTRAIAGLFIIVSGASQRSMYYSKS
jgi:hypothetical protein